MIGPSQKAQRTSTSSGGQAILSPRDSTRSSAYSSSGESCQFTPGHSPRLLSQEQLQSLHRSSPVPPSPEQLSPLSSSSLPPPSSSSYPPSRPSPPPLSSFRSPLSPPTTTPRSLPCAAPDSPSSTHPTIAKPPSTLSSQPRSQLRVAESFTLESSSPRSSKELRASGCRTRRSWDRMDTAMGPRRHRRRSLRRTLPSLLPTPLLLCRTLEMRRPSRSSSRSETPPPSPLPFPPSRPSFPSTSTALFRQQRSARLCQRASRPSSFSSRRSRRPESGRPSSSISLELSQRATMRSPLS